MTRTRRRPLPAHQVEPERAVVFGLALGVISFVVMAWFVNLLAAFLTLLAIGFYVVVYTMLLKRSTPQNIVIGGAAGALPPVIGWAAVTGNVGIPAIVLFALVFYWTPPHFWALSLRIRKDYAAAGVPMLPVVKGIPETTRQIALYTLLMVAISLVLLAGRADGLDLPRGRGRPRGGLPVAGVRAVAARLVRGGLDRRRDQALQVLDQLPVPAVRRGRGRRPRPRSDVNDRATAAPSGRPRIRHRASPVTMRGMQIHFLGGATTVTGSQFLLATDRARVLIDCGMFQGSPNESIRNRIPFGFDPAELDAVLLTHAHLDHCGLLPLLVKAGYRGRSTRPPAPSSWRRSSCSTRASSTRSSPSARRAGRSATPTWSRPTTARRPTSTRRRSTWPRRAVRGGGRGRDAGAPRLVERPAIATAEAPPIGEHVETTVEPGSAAWPPDPEAELRAQPPELDVDLDAAAVHGQGRRADARPFPARRLRRGARGRAGRPRHVPRCRAHPRLGDHPAARPGREGGEERVIVCSGDLGRPGHADPARPDRHDRRRLRPHRVDLRRPRARTAGGGHPDPGRDDPDGRRGERRPARPVVRDRPDPGGRLGARPAHRARRDPAAAALSRLADGVEGVRHLPPLPRLLRRGDRRAPARGRHAARLPEPDRHQRRRRRRRRSSAPRGRT